MPTLVYSLRDVLPANRHAAAAKAVADWLTRLELVEG